MRGSRICWRDEKAPVKWMRLNRLWWWPAGVWRIWKCRNDIQVSGKCMEYGRAISIAVDDARQYLDAMKANVKGITPVNGGVREWKKEWYPKRSATLLRVEL